MGPTCKSKCRRGLADHIQYWYGSRVHPNLLVGNSKDLSYKTRSLAPQANEPAIVKFGNCPDTERLDVDSIYDVTNWRLCWNPAAALPTAPAHHIEQGIALGSNPALPSETPASDSLKTPQAASFCPIVPKPVVPKFLGARPTGSTIASSKATLSIPQRASQRLSQHQRDRQASLPDEQWDMAKPYIKILYQEQNMPLKSVITAMKTKHNFDAT